MTDWTDWTCGCNMSFSFGGRPQKRDTTGHLHTCHLFEEDNTKTLLEDISDIPDVTTISCSKEDSVKIETVVEKSGDILANLLDSKKENLSTSFDSWMTKVLDNEAERKKTLNLSAKIKESLSRQLQDGLLSYYEYIDLEYTGRIWIRLLNTVNAYHLGSACNKKDILSLLLELLELKQISKELFIESALQL